MHGHEAVIFKRQKKYILLIPEIFLSTSRTEV